MILPVDFETRTKQLLGDEYTDLAKALETDAPVSVRINNAKGMTPPDAEPVPWSEAGYYLADRPTFTFDPLFHAGCYYVQEAASMFLEKAVKTYIDNPVRCLDLCAAPGGKSTHLLGILPEGSLLVSNEVIRSRSVVLAENIAKWGMAGSVVCNNDPAEIGKLTHYFDVIVTDVPCSGEGMFRKDVASRDEWSEANVQLCAARQRRIIHDIWDALKPGGLLIYSTCTYNAEENEDNIEYITRELGAEVLDVPTDTSWSIHGAVKGNMPVYRFMPHRTKGEGFFLAVLRKAEGEFSPIKIRAKKDKQDKKAPSIPTAINDWLNDAKVFHTAVHNGVVEAFPIDYKDDYLLLTDRLHIVSAGVRVGEIKGKDLVPHPALGLSTALNRDVFTQVDVIWEDAIRYLRKEAFALPTEIAKGYVLITYQGYPLGFAKHLGNRANNLYPQEWRIRTSYTPDEVKTLL
jgi:tRNA and rRNA cytosine-C5-methylases